jgi:hypothetical protein
MGCGRLHHRPTGVKSQPAKEGQFLTGADNEGLGWTAITRSWSSQTFSKMKGEELSLLGGVVLACPEDHEVFEHFPVPGRRVSA